MEDIYSKKRKYRLKNDLSAFFYPHEWIELMKLATKRQKIALDILINTGARYTEAKNIEVSDIDWERNNITIRKTKRYAKRGEKAIRHKYRIIHVNSQFIKRLKIYIKKHNLGQDDYFNLPAIQSMNSAIKKLAKVIGRADWKDFSPHNIRKTSENWLLALGADGFEVCKRFGHTPNIALKHYLSADIFNKQDKTLMRKIMGDLYKD